MINNADSSLWNAIKRLKAARTRKALPKIIRMLEDRVREEAERIIHVVEKRDQILRHFGVDPTTRSPLE